MNSLCGAHQLCKIKPEMSTSITMPLINVVLRSNGNCRMATHATFSDLLDVVKTVFKKLKQTCQMEFHACVDNGDKH